MFSGSVTGTVGTQMVDASATVTVNAGYYTVVITNLEGDPISSVQAIGGLQIDFGAPAPGSPTLASQSGTLIDVAGKGGGVSFPGGSPNHWEVTSLNDVTTLSGMKPNDLIVGPGPYTSTNNGFGGFNPYIWKTGTFVIDFTGPVPGAVTGLTFDFGTNAKDVLTTTTITTSGGPSPIPEPSTWGLMLLGLFGLGTALRFGKRPARMIAT
jgi:hypothetical protein